jgi:sulfite exporter TauE/SafE
VDTAYVLAFTTGILGGAGHCIGMCGPLVASYSLAAPAGDAQRSGRVFIPHLLYNLGRISTYGAIGAIMGFSGSFVNTVGRFANIQNVVAVASGLMMIFMGLGIMGAIGTTAWIEKHNRTVLRLAVQVRKSASTLRYYLLGLLFGLLPCGLSYTIFIASAGTGAPIPGALTALLFGIGTLPALVFFGALITSLQAGRRKMIYRASGVVVLIMGCFYLYRGIMLYAGL